MAADRGPCFYDQVPDAVGSIINQYLPLPDIFKLAKTSIARKYQHVECVSVCKLYPNIDSYRAEKSKPILKRLNTTNHSSVNSNKHCYGKDLNLGDTSDFSDENEMRFTIIMFSISVLNRLKIPST